VAGLLAARLGWPVVDCDRRIAAAVGCAIPEIFAREGEGGFRDREARELQAALAEPGPVLISTGGGVVERPENREALAACEHLVVYLAAAAAVLAARLAADPGDRPSLTGSTVAEEVERMLARREAWYRAAADRLVDANPEPETVAAAVLAIVESERENPTEC